MSHNSHDWGPHERGLRWVQCRSCKCLLHEPEAETPCTHNPDLTDMARQARRLVSQRTLMRIARVEAGIVESRPESHGLFQMTPNEQRTYARATLMTPRDYREAALQASRFVRSVGEVSGGDGRVTIPIRGPMGFTPDFLKRKVARKLQPDAPVNTEVLVSKRHSKKGPR